MAPYALEKLIFPPKDASDNGCEPPDWCYIDTEMRRPHVTRQLLWMEYKAQFGIKALGYSQFCRCYREWKKTRRLSMRQEHRAGEKLFIDFCGPTVPIVNPDTGEVLSFQSFSYQNNIVLIAPPPGYSPLPDGTF